MDNQTTYTPTLTYNAEPDEVIGDLCGVSCILQILAASDMTNHNNIGDAYSVMAEIIDAATHKLSRAIDNLE